LNLLETGVCLREWSPARISEDGRTVLMMDDTSFVVYNVTDGTARSWQAVDSATGEEMVCRCKLSPDGRFVLATTPIEPSGAVTFGLDLVTGETTLRLPHPDPSFEPHWSPDGTEVVIQEAAIPNSGCCADQFTLVDLVTGSTSVFYTALNGLLDYRVEWTGGKPLVIPPYGLSPSRAYARAFDPDLGEVAVTDEIYPIETSILISKPGAKDRVIDLLPLLTQAGFTPPAYDPENMVSPSAFLTRVDWIPGTRRLWFVAGLNGRFDYYGVVDAESGKGSIRAVDPAPVHVRGWWFAPDGSTVILWTDTYEQRPDAPQVELHAVELDDADLDLRAVLVGRVLSARPRGGGLLVMTDQEVGLVDLQTGEYTRVGPFPVVSLDEFDDGRLLIAYPDAVYLTEVGREAPAPWYQPDPGEEVLGAWVLDGEHIAIGTSTIILVTDPDRETQVTVARAQEGAHYIAHALEPGGTRMAASRAGPGGSYWVDVVPLATGGP